MAGEKTEKQGKIKKKKWVKVVAPKLFQNELIGEVPVIEAKSLVGRKITVNLMTITNDMKKQHINMEFLISSVKADTAFTDHFGYYLNPSSIKRLIRRGKEKVNLSIVCRTADNMIIRVKPLIIPFSSIQNSAATAYRKESTDFLGAYIAKTTFENIIRDLIDGKLQKDLKSVLKKIHPIRILEISKMYIENEKRAAESKIVKVVPREEAPAPEEEDSSEEEEKKEEEKSEGDEETKEEDSSDEEEPQEEQDDDEPEEKPKHSSDDEEENKGEEE